MATKNNRLSGREALGVGNCEKCPAVAKCIGYWDELNGTEVRIEGLLDTVVKPDDAVVYYRVAKRSGKLSVVENFAGRPIEDPEAFMNELRALAYDDLRNVHSHREILAEEIPKLTDGCTGPIKSISLNPLVGVEYVCTTPDTYVSENIASDTSASLN